MLPDDLEADPEPPESPPLQANPPAAHASDNEDRLIGPVIAPTLESAGPPLDNSSPDKAEELRTSLALLFERLSETADEVTVKWRDPLLAPKKKTGREKLAGFAKDFGSLLTGVGSILTSLILGVATLTLAVFTYRSNANQAAVTQKNLKTAALNDFAETDREKRTLAAIRLAVYGEDALPAIKLALGVSNNAIRSGAVQTAKVMYQSQPETRAKLLQEMTGALADNNPYLRLGTLEFYSDAADDLTITEKQDFLKLLEIRIGSDAKGCSIEPDEFLLEYASFLTKGPFPDAPKLLLSLGRSCPAKKEHIRIQAVNALALVAEKLPLAERSLAVNELESLKPAATELLNGSIDQAIDRIKRSTNP